MMLTGFDPNQIQNLEGAQEAIVLMLNLVEEVKQENDQLRETIQRLRDEINRLKGEQGKPDIKSNKKKGKGEDYSSEKERRKRKKWQKGSKLNKVKIDREQVQAIDIGQVVNGRCNRDGDLDFYRFEAKHGERLLIKCAAERIDSHFRPIRTKMAPDTPAVTAH